MGSRLRIKCDSLDKEVWQLGEGILAMHLLEKDSIYDVYSQLFRVLHHLTIFIQLLDRNILHLRKRMQCLVY